MPRSNENISRAIGETLEQYKSQYTGEAVDAALKAATEIMPFLETNIIIPPITFTGDFLLQSVTTLSRAMFLSTITLECKRAFSKSASEIGYQITSTDGSVSIAIPTEFMQSEGDVLIYQVNKLIQTGTTINMICSSTRAFGEILVKAEMN